MHRSANAACHSVGRMSEEAPTYPSAIKVVMCDGNRHPLGTFWRFKATSNDFYIEPLGSGSAEVHLSVHGPTKRHPNHRFHIKVREHHVKAARDQGYLVAHGLPKDGHVVPGRKVEGAEAYLVMRLRWSPALRDPSYLAAARSTDTVPELGPSEVGGLLDEALDPGFALDLDVYVGFGAPYWPPMTGRTVGDPKLGPLANDKDMYVTVLSVDRDDSRTPAPSDLVPALPDSEDNPGRLLCGGPDDDGDIYWWVETIVAREIIDATRDAQTSDGVAASDKSNS